MRQTDRTDRAPLLRMEGVGKSFGDVTALRGLSFALEAGEVMSLLGPSGCGKSTALRLIAGLGRPTAGRLVWDAPIRTGDLAVVFQEPTLMPWATVAENVRLPFRLQRRPRREVADEVGRALALVGLERFADAHPRALSLGMKMRVSIARALVTRPRLILMDEPFAALDEITRQRLNADLLSLRAELGCTIVFVTHSVAEAVFLSDRVAVMSPRPGRVVAELTVDPGGPRDEAFRTSAAFVDHAREASAALRTAMAEPA